jgi:hypothetical protein
MKVGLWLPLGFSFTTKKIYRVITWGMCYIICKIGPICCTLIWEQGDRRVGIFCVHFFAFFQQMVFVDGFLISVKQLGLLINMDQWIRGLDATGSYIVNNEGI